MFNNYGYNPYYQPQRVQAAEQYAQPTFQPKIPGLLGKSVDSIDVVKAMDIPLDGSVSYFPLTDGSAIVSKQLQSDGTSKTVIFKPINEQQNEETKFVTMDEFKKMFDEIDLNDIDDLKEQLKDLKRELKELKAKIKNKGEKDE